MGKPPARSKKAVPPVFWLCLVLLRQVRLRVGSMSRVWLSISLRCYAMGACFGTRRTHSPPSDNGRAVSSGRVRCKRKLITWPAMSLSAGSKRSTRGWRGCAATTPGGCSTPGSGYPGACSGRCAYSGAFSQTATTPFSGHAIAALGPESRWAQLLSSSFGVGQGNGDKGPSLHETVRAGLQLYCETFELLREAIAAEHFPLIEETVCLIRSQLQVEE